MRVRFLVAAGVALVLLGPAASAYAACASLLPAASVPGHPQPVQAADLLSLRDVGQPDASAFGQLSPFALSPDGDEAAFLVTRADPDANRTCRGIVLLNLSDGRARLANAGGEDIPAQGAFRGAVIAQGAPKTIVPAWSPDGRRIAFLRRDGGVSRAWVVTIGNLAAQPVTPAGENVLDLGWSTDGTALIVKTSPATEAQAAAVDEEGKHGWLYDERIWPMFGVRPMTPAGLPDAIERVELSGGGIRPATAAEVAAAHLPADDIFASPARAIGPQGRAFVAPRDTTPFSPPLVHWTDKTGTSRVCMVEACGGHILNLWWDGPDLLILRQDGWAYEKVSLYRWRPGASSAKRVLATSDALHGCQFTSSGLLCTDEAARQPRRIVLVDCASGAIRPLYDLNPEFEHITLGSVRRLHWRNALGLEARGDLVLPPDYRPGTRLPLIVVQYRSDGFLRGGTGDEYPIFLFAAHGMAVLSVEKTEPATSLRPRFATATAEIQAEIDDWSERRSLLSTVDRGIAQAIDAGVADPRRLGISGLSDGATTVQFALLNGRHFAAAAMSTCCNEPDSMLTYAGLREAAFFRMIGYPPVTAHDTRFWADMSLAQNAASVTTPLLMQVADSEFVLALQAFGALREQHCPVEMYVFPDEFHEKVEPIHRLAIYERNLDWFRFWLLDQRDPAPSKAAQYTRWEAMRPATPGGEGITPSNAPMPRHPPAPSS